MIALELDEAWLAEARCGRPDPYQGRRLTSLGDLEVYAGLDASGRRRFVGLRITQAQRKLVGDRFPRSSSGIVVENVVADGGTSAIFLREQPGIPESVFRTVMHDVLSIATSTDSLRTAFERFAAWQRALQRSLGPLTGPEVRGILGEVILLRDIIVPAVGLSTALQWWRSPVDDHVHDFVGSSFELEVKAMLAGGTSFHVNARGQLEAAQEQRMFLATVELERDEAGIRVADVVAELEALAGGEQPVLAQLRDSVVKRGLGMASTEGEVTVPYRLHGIRFFEVGDGFPLIPSARLHPGISALEYEVELAACIGFATDVAEVTQALRVGETRN